jgi:hypothetical protein
MADAPPVLTPPEEEPLNDLAQPFLGFVRREKNVAGSWLQCVQDGPGLGRLTPKPRARSPWGGKGWARRPSE